MTFPNIVPGYIPEGEPILRLPPIELIPEALYTQAMLAESRDWGHVPLQIEELHAKGIKGSGVTVAILDTGIDLGHPDLAPNAAPSGHKNFTTNNPNDSLDRQGHGTHCAGIVAAANQGNGIIGASPETKLVRVKVLSDSGSGYSTWIDAGVVHAADQGVDIISMSLGGGGSSQQSRDAIKYAISKGCWVVVAAGNSGQGGIGFPGGYTECITVAATDKNNNPANFSSRGTALDVAAPGVQILSTYINGQFATLSGTSMATPYVSGCLALIRGELKRLGLRIPMQDEIEKYSRETAKDLGTPGHDRDTGFGLIQPVALLARLLEVLGPPPSPPVVPPVPPVPPVPTPTGFTGAIVSTWKNGSLQSEVVTPGVAPAAMPSVSVIWANLMLILDAWRSNDIQRLVRAIAKLLEDLGVQSSFLFCERIDSTTVTISSFDVYKLWAAIKVCGEIISAFQSRDMAAVIAAVDKLFNLIGVGLLVPRRQ